MQDYLSPEVFADVWNRVAPQGSGGIVPKAPKEQPSTTEPTSTTSSLAVCCLLVSQMEREDLLRRGLRLFSEQHPHQALQESVRRGRQLCQLLSRLTGRMYRTQHIFDSRWMEQPLLDLSVLCHHLEAGYRHGAEHAPNEHIHALFLSYAQELRQLRHLLNSPFSNE
ncbi:MAG: hypothetical protein MJ077_08660 [Oscillospiraceae bacterium]|nr:hypothetical protein [Oscillospiraceae bacterium]